MQGVSKVLTRVMLARAAALVVSRKGIPFAYLPFEGEGHGFRKAETIKRCFEAELFFYGAVLGFPLGEDVAPVEIENRASPAVTRGS